MDAAKNLLVLRRAGACLQMELLVDGVNVMQECRLLLNRAPQERAPQPITTLVKGACLHTWHIPHFCVTILRPRCCPSWVFVQKEPAMLMLKLANKRCKIQQYLCLKPGHPVTFCIHFCFIHPHETAEKGAGWADHNTEWPLIPQICPHCCTAMDLCQVCTILKVERKPRLQAMLACK